VEAPRLPIPAPRPRTCVTSRKPDFFPYPPYPKTPFLILSPFFGVGLRKADYFLPLRGGQSVAVSFGWWLPISRNDHVLSPCNGMISDISPPPTLPCRLPGSARPRLPPLPRVPTPQYPGSRSSLHLSLERDLPPRFPN